LWRTRLGVPVLAGLAASGDWLVVASYDGSVRAFTHGDRPIAADLPATCSEPTEPGGCCGASGGAPTSLLGTIALLLARRRRRA
jgi:hypothetical protein